MRKGSIGEPLKILVPTEGPELSAGVSDRLGTSPWLLTIDAETMSFEARRNPGASGQKGAGMQTVAFAIGENIAAVLTGYCSPIVEKYLTANGIAVVKGIGGTAADAVSQFKKGPPEPQLLESGGVALLKAFTRAFRQFSRMLPMIGGIILLIGLFNAFVPRKFLRAFFPGGMKGDILSGALAGSFFAGNPINSYIIGGGLLAQGVSLFGVTAFMVAWVSVGWVQLPAEIGALGSRFAIARNVLSLIMAMGVALLTVIVPGVLLGGGF